MKESCIAKSLKLIWSGKMKYAIIYFIHDKLQKLNRYFWFKATDGSPVSLVPINNVWYWLAYNTNKAINKLRRIKVKKK